MALHEKSSQQRATENTNDREKVLTAKAGVDAEYCKFPENLQAAADGIQAFLFDKKVCASDFDGVWVRLLISKKGLERYRK